MNQNLINEYHKLDWNKLARKDLGEHSLEIVKVSLNGIKEIFDNILEYKDFELMPQIYLQSVENSLRSFLDLSKRILHFSNLSEKEQLIQQVRSLEGEVYTNVSAVLGYIEWKDPLKNKTNKKAVKEVSNIIDELSEKSSKIEELLNKAQIVATKGETLKYGDFFGSEATANSTAANWSFWLMITSIFLTGFLAIVILESATFELFENNKWSDIVHYINSQNLLIKFVLISLCVYMIAHFSKTHSSEKHLYNINIQKQNALNSYEQILDSVTATESENDKEIRNSILLELTRAIFEAKDTGYLKGGNHNASPVSQIVEVGKNITK